MDNPTALLRWMLLAMVISPLVAAVVVALLRRWVRRVTCWFAFLHLGGAIALALLASASIQGRAGEFASDVRGDYTFMPAGVPGDPGEEFNTFSTTWSIFELQPPHLLQPPTEVQFFLGLDGLNVWLLVLTSLMTVIAVLVSWDTITENPSRYYAWLLALEGLVIGAFTAFDVVVFYVFFELTLIPIFFLIGGWGIGGGRRDAARKFFLYTLAGSLLTLTGLIGIVITNPTPVNPKSELGMPMFKIQGMPDNTIPMPVRGSMTFSIPMLAINAETWSTAHHYQAHVSKLRAIQATEVARTANERLAAEKTDPELQRAAEQAATAQKFAEEELTTAIARRDSYLRIQTWLFVLLMAGLAVKIPIVPFHTWLPAAYGEAPMGVTIMLAAVLSKLGTYGVLRLVLPFTPDAALNYGLPVFGTLGAIGIVYGAFCAFAQRDLKLLIAYSSVSHMAFLVIGLFTFNIEGLNGAALHMVNHGLSTGALFAVLAVLATRYRTLLSDQYSGLWAIYPGLTFLAFVATLASIGLPGLNNFVSEMLILAGIFHPSNTRLVGYSLGVIAAIGILLSAWYMMTMLRRVFFGPLAEPPNLSGHARSLSGREILAVGLPAALCLLLGVFPQPVIKTIRTDALVVAQFGESARKRARVELSPTKVEHNFRPNPVVRGANDGPRVAGEEGR